MNHWIYAYRTADYNEMVRCRRPAKSRFTFALELVLAFWFLRLNCLLMS